MALPVDASGRKLRAVSGTNVTAALPWTIKPAEAKALQRGLLAHADVKAALGKNRHRLLSFEPIVEPTKKGPPAGPQRWRAVVYDYVRNRAVIATTGAGPRGKVEVAVRRAQPLPSPDEWEDAVAIIAADPELGPLLARGEIAPYRAMPPLAEREAALGEIERALNVGLRPVRGARFANTIVAVNMIRRAVERYPGGAPPTARANLSMCGAPDPDNFSSPPRGTPGSCWISWPADRPLWRFLVVRPSASSGTRGSGIEILYADYNGQRVLYQGHVPILNVLYDGDACGPYRDWQWQEHNFHADGVDIAPGFRWCTSPPQTIIESGNDQGNFNGVAIHDEGHSLRLVSEMEAGWYRYISEWRFGLLGSIQPRFGFSATANSCVCNVHHHHAYWRFDLDVDGAGGDVVEERDDTQSWKQLTHEVRRARDPATRRRWRVRNTTTTNGLTYEITPGPDDGVADAYGRGDLWFVRYRGAAEIDDGYDSTGGNGTAANIDAFVTGESIDRQDVVVWYGAHFRHALGEADAGHAHVLGPTLAPPIRCPFTARATELRLAERDLDDLRRFRDGVLGKTPGGKKYVAALADHAEEIVELLAADAALETRAAGVTGSLLALVRGGRGRSAPVIDDAALADAGRVLAGLEARARPELKAIIAAARGDLARLAGTRPGDAAAKLRGPR